jgi:hypothetical protein
MGSGYDDGVLPGSVWALPLTSSVGNILTRDNGQGRFCSIWLQISALEFKLELLPLSSRPSLPFLLEATGSHSPACDVT